MADGDLFRGVDMSVIIAVRMRAGIVQLPSGAVEETWNSRNEPYGYLPSLRLYSVQAQKHSLVSGYVFPNALCLERGETQNRLRGRPSRTVPHRQR